MHRRFLSEKRSPYTQTGKRQIPHKINYTQNRLIVLSTSIYRVAELLHNQNVNVIGKQTAKTMLVSHVLKSGDAVDAVGIIVEVVHSVASKSR